MAESGRHEGVIRRILRALGRRLSSWGEALLAAAERQAADKKRLAVASSRDAPDSDTSGVGANANAAREDWLRRVANIPSKDWVRMSVGTTSPADGAGLGRAHERGAPGKPRGGDILPGGTVGAGGGPRASVSAESGADARATLPGEGAKGTEPNSMAGQQPRAGLHRFLITAERRGQAEDAQGVGRVESVESDLLGMNPTAPGRQGTAVKLPHYPERIPLQPSVLSLLSGRQTRRPSAPEVHYPPRGVSSEAGRQDESQPGNAELPAWPKVDRDEVSITGGTETSRRGEHRAVATEHSVSFDEHRGSNHELRRSKLPDIVPVHPDVTRRGRNSRERKTWDPGSAEFRSGSDHSPVGPSSTASVSESERPVRGAADDSSRSGRQGPAPAAKTRPGRLGELAPAGLMVTTVQHRWPELPPLPWETEPRYESEPWRISERLRRLELEQLGHAWNGSRF